MRPVVCMISDRRRLRGDAGELVERIRAVALAGAQLVQIRERDLADGVLLTLVTRAVDAVRGTHTRILVNERADIAVAAGAHGVHLRADSIPASRVRAIVPRGFLIGRSVHSAEETAQAVADGGADYLLFGTVYETSSKPGREAVGVDGLARAAAAAAGYPVLAVGGITTSRSRELQRSGCAGFAAIGLFAEPAIDALPDVVTEVMRPWDNRA